MQKQYGLRVYADKAFDKVNDKWIVPMLRNVRGSDIFVAFISQSYIESYACFLELLTAVNNRKKLVVVSLEEQLHLGDTTNLPIVNRGVKNEILNQGANIATNTNNTSNDIMRAMKSAFTSLSTLLEQDALSKYDISDAFINFLRDASLNRKTINDLGSLRKSIKSVSRDVFDQSLIAAAVQKAASAQEEEQPEPVVAEPEPKLQPDIISQAEPDLQPEPEPKADFSFSDSENGKGAKKPLNVKRIGGVIAIIAAVVVFSLVLLGGTKQVTNMEYTTSDGISGTYTGGWRKEQPNGQGTFTDSDGKVSEGEWKNGNLGGTGTITWANGSVYEGELHDGEPSGTGTKTWSTGDVYEGEWKDGKCDGTGSITWENGDAYEGEFKDNIIQGQGVFTWADGSKFEGEFLDGTKNGEGVYTKADGTTVKETWVSEQTMEWAGGTYTGPTKDGKSQGTGSIT